MINSQQLSHNQKLKLWREHKEDKFKQIAGDRCATFNYFINNNDIFGFIKPEDYILYSIGSKRMLDLQANIFIGCFIGVVLFDRLILNRFFPRIRFQKWRLTANLIKYIVWPIALFKPLDYVLLYNTRQFMYNMQEEYNFGFPHYLKATRIFERALAVNKLEQLLQKRAKFDWTGIPELPDSPVS